MGRTGRRAAKQAAVISATPATDNAGPKDLMHGRDADLGNADKPSGPKVSKVKTGAFFTVPPRTELLDTKKDANGPDTFKHNPVKQVGLWEIQAAIWAKTAASKGGAKDPTAAPAERAVRLIQEKAELEQGGQEEALMSAEGFRAYAHEMIWGVRAEGEADDEPLDEADPVQVAERMRMLWRNWRKLPAEQQRKWADKQLAQEAAVALQRTAGTKHLQPAKVRRAAASVPTADPISGKSKGKHGMLKKQRKSKGSTEDRLEEDYKRAEALRFSRVALLAEMRNWEEEDEEEEAAAAAGVTVDELRKKRQEEKEAAKKNAAEAAAEEADQEDNKEQDEAAVAGTSKAAASKGKKRKEAPAGRRSRKAATEDDEQQEEKEEPTKQQQKPASKRVKRALAPPAAGKAAKADAKADAKPSGSAAAVAAPYAAAAGKGKKKASIKAAAASNAASGQLAKKEAEGLGWIESDADEDSDEDAVGADEMAEMHKALSDGDDSAADDSDADASDQDIEEEKSDDEQEPEEEQQRRAASAKGVRVKSSAAIAQAKAEAARKAAAAAAKAAAKAAAAAAAAEAEARAADAEAKAVAAKAKRPAKGKKAAAETQKASKAADGGSRKRKAAAAAETGDDAPAAPAVSDKKHKQQQSPRRSGRSQRPTEDAPAAVEEDDGPAVSGAGPSSVPRRGRSAAVGGAKAAQQEALELQLFSNTRRKSVGRADSPGLVALAAAAAHQQQQPRSRLGKGRK